jgi:16S rRNA G966 N2-methylase RsmD
MLPMFQYKVDYGAYVLWRKSDQSQVLLADLVGCAKGRDFDQIGALEQDALVRKFATWLRSRGFSRLVGDLMDYREGRKILEFEVSKISDENAIRFSHVGSKFIASFFPNFWEAKAKGSLSPKEMFNDDSFLFEIIRDILSEGAFPKSRHVLSKLRLYRHNKSVSLFMPCVAKAVYCRLAPAGSKVLDFCGGYGGRLMGALACPNVISYTGIDANKQSCEGLNHLYWHMHRREGVDKEVTITHGDSIESMKRFSDDAFDFCFTSPPYFNAEKYEEGEGQSSSQYQEYGSWLTDYLFVAVREACRISKVVAINVANTGAYPIADDLRKWIGTEMRLASEMKLVSPRLGGGKREEPLFVLSRKGTPPPTT